MASEREELYNTAVGGVDPTEEKVETEVTETPAEKEVTPEVKEEIDVSEKVEGEEEIVGEEDKTKEKGDLKSALKEERIKRRQIKSEYEAKIAEKERQLNEVLQALRSTTTSEPETIADYETEILSLKSKVNEIDNWRQKTAVQSEEETRQRSYKELMLRIDGTSMELEKEGYPGFTRFKSLISEELNKMPDAERMEMDNEEGWKEIYKDTVFPSIKPIFQSITKAEKDARKTQDKQKMGMLGESKGEEQIKKDDTWTMDDYLAWRKKQTGG